MEPKLTKKWYQMKRTWIGIGFLSFLFLLSGVDTTTTSESTQSNLNGSANVIQAVSSKTSQTVNDSKTYEVETVKTPVPKINLEEKAVQKCHPSYSGACLKPDASDYDCAGGSGNGPYYTGRVSVVGSDFFDLDRDGDGVGCE